MQVCKSAAAQLRPVATAALILAERFAVVTLHLPDRFDVAQRFDLVTLGAHELIGFGAPPCIRRRVFANKVFGLLAIFNAAFAVLLFQQDCVFARGQIKPAHVSRRALFVR